jgi:hypothetical protein
MWDLIWLHVKIITINWRTDSHESNNYHNEVNLSMSFF